MESRSKNDTACRMRSEASPSSALKPAVAPTRTGVKERRSSGTAASASRRRSESDSAAARGLVA